MPPRRYALPGGDEAFVYRQRKTRVDERPPAVTGLADDYNLSAGPDLGDIDDLARDLLKAGGRGGAGRGGAGLGLVACSRHEDWLGGCPTLLSPLLLWMDW